MGTAHVALPETHFVSAIPGRQRWSVPAIDSRPRLAAAVEMALRKDPRVLSANANPLTGRVLIKWDPAQRPPAIRSLIGSALTKGPVSETVYRKAYPAPHGKIARLVNKLI